MHTRGKLIVIASAVLMAVIVACSSSTPPPPAASAPAAAPAPPLAPASVVSDAFVAPTPQTPATPQPAAPAAPALPAISGTEPIQVFVAPARRSSSSDKQRLEPTATPIPVEFPVTIIDSNGNEVTFDKPPERIVAYDGAAVETLFAMGEGHRIVATHSFVSFPTEADDIPRVGGAFDINIEETVALEPDLVFIFFERFAPDLERAGLKVLYIQTLNDDFTKIPDRMRMWGQIVGKPEASEKLATEFDKRLNEIKETLAPYGDGPTVFQDEGDLWTPGPDTIVGEVLDLLKLNNIAHDVSGYAQLSPEIIVERNPTYMIASYGDTLSDNPAFKNVSAIKNKRVFVPSSNALSIAGPRFLDGVEELARWAYPGIFSGGN